MITPLEKKEMLTIFRKHYDNLKMRCDIDNATLMLAILPAMQEYAKSNIPAVIHSLPEDATTCIICGEFEPYCKCKDGYKRHFLAEQHELLLANGFISTKVEMPKPSEKNRYFSEKLMLLVGKRKYKGVFSFHFNRFYKDGFHIENYIFEIEKVNGWRLL